jgi:S1-C subfamily serine protease
VVATVAAVVTASGPAAKQATDTSLVTAPAGAGNVTIGPDVMNVVDAVEPSLVSLIPAGSSSGNADATGVVLPAGNLVLTAAGAVNDGEHLMVVSSQGQRQSGEVTAVDDPSGVAVVLVQDAMTPGSFVDEPVTPRQLAVAACRCVQTAGTGDGTGASPSVAVGMVRATGGNDDGGPSLVDAIEAEMPLGHGAWGSVLLDDEGDVLGILDGERSSDGDTFGYFVPASLAVAVADELARDHTVRRGWLGVMCQDDGGAGAAVTTVLPGSPAAAAGMEPGDVVEAVDSHLVSSLADLQARLYVSPPGTTLALTVVRAGAVHTVPVTVSAGPS